MHPRSLQYFSKAKDPKWSHQLEEMTLHMTHLASVWLDAAPNKLSSHTDRPCTVVTLLQVVFGGCASQCMALSTSLFEMPTHSVTLVSSAAL